MVNDHIEARLWADHGPLLSQSLADGFARLSRLLRRAAQERLAAADKGVCQSPDAITR